MTRTLFGLILLANLGLFAYIRWGNLLTHADSASLQVQQSFNAEKIRLLGFSAGEPAAAGPPSAPPAKLHPEPSAPQPSSQPQGVKAPAVSSPVPDACMEWGEFSGTDLTSATADLATLNLGANLTQREAEHAIGYWVYIPPLKTRAAVNTKISQLKKLGIKEYFVVQEKGRWQNTISLGVFKTEGSAHKFLDKLKTRGVRSAVMGERQTRLKFTVFILRNPGARILAKLAEWQKDFTDIEMKSTPCN
jgi:SPOR domain